MLIRAKYVLQFSRRDVLQNTDFDPAAIENRRLVWTFSFRAAGSKGLVFDFYLNRKRNKISVGWRRISSNFNIYIISKLISVVQLIARLCRYVIAFPFHTDPRGHEFISS